MYNHIIAIIPFLRAGADKSLKGSPAGPGICPGFSFPLMRNIIFRMDKENLVKITQLRHRLHQCAELSGRERETGRLLREFLKDNTSLEIIEKNGWFYAVKRGADLKAGSIAFRADMDALPIEESIPLPYASLHAGVSHKCGHDGHSAALCGLALELDVLAPAKTVYLLFQKAEEIGKGGKYCAAFIKETGISEVYAFHNLNGFPVSSIVYRRGLTQPASEGLELRFLGKTSHASAPEDGRNPAAAIAETVLYAERLLQERYNGMVLCTVTGIQAGTGDFGISAGEGSLRMTLRAEYEADMALLLDKILAFARACADKAGLKTEHAIFDYFPETRNSDFGIRRVLAAADRLHLKTVEMEKLWRASEDFGYCLKECPGAMFYIGTGEHYPALHTKEYDFNDRILETAADMFLTLAQTE